MLDMFVPSHGMTNADRVNTTVGKDTWRLLRSVQSTFCIYDGFKLETSATGSPRVASC
jgi:hypothetical protein